MRDALIVVDVQNDFCPGGSLAVPQGDAVVPVMNRYVQQATESGMAVFASRDWHPRETRHFAEFGGPWPVHCVQNTPGAEFHQQLRLPPEAWIVTKGTSAEDAGYSAFEGTLPDGSNLADELRRLGVRRVHVGGLATDYCVRATVLDALAAGFETFLLQDASRPVDVSPGDGERAVGEMLAAGAQLETVDTFAAA
ncbi:MAG TPA: nicotinamidase [Ktedonobacterales bacterium]|nr:nicotinamidase [Ktedonobacterales bacterium]